MAFGRVGLGSGWAATQLSSPKVGEGVRPHLARGADLAVGSTRRSWQILVTFERSGRLKGGAAPMITGEQVRTARRPLGWSMAAEAVVSETTVRNLEGGYHQVTDQRIVAIQRALAKRGVEFTNGGEPQVGFMKRPL
jgi:hypothetical protein